MEAVPRLGFFGLPHFHSMLGAKAHRLRQWPAAPSEPMGANATNACAQCLQRRQPRVDPSDSRVLVCWLLVGPIGGLQERRSWQFSPKPAPARQSRPRLLLGGVSWGDLQWGQVGPQRSCTTAEPPAAQTFSRWSPISSALGEGPSSPVAAMAHPETPSFQLPWLGPLHPRELRFPFISLP